MAESKKICSMCGQWRMGVPVCTCKLTNMVTSDRMVFTDAGKYCPYNKPGYRLEKLKNVKEVLSDLAENMKLRGIQGAVVGISGGKDSTIVAKMMVEILGKENVVGVLMPNGEQKDISDSYRVVELLGIKHTVINIGDSFTALTDVINSGIMDVTPDGRGTSCDARINIAPRIRMTVLYAVAQSMGSGWRVIGTTNKSENYIGWLTKWGDGGVDYEPIIDLSVTELRQFGKDLGLPADLVDKVPVDGLTPYTDEDRLGFSYAELDKYMEEGTTGDKEKDKKIEDMHTYSEHKRRPIPYFNLKI